MQIEITSKDYSNQIGKQIIVKENNKKKKCINIEKIMYIKCEDYLTTLFLENNTTIVEIKTLKEFEKNLSDLGFFRINKNTIINGRYITEVDTKIKARLVSLGEICLQISKRSLKLFKHWFFEYPLAAIK